MSETKIFASCHNHSTFSDGVYTPEEMMDIAKGLGHGGFILTDHDTVRGTYFAVRAARERGMKSMLGCEFSTYHEGVGVHLLGFDFNPDNKKMQELLAFASGCQTGRTRLMFKWGQERGTLSKELTWQDVLDDHPYHDYFCNNQVFESFLKRGIYKREDYQWVFLKPNFSYMLGLEDRVKEELGYAYSDIQTIDVIKTILEAEGVPIVAHPVDLAKFADTFVEAGAMGFEVVHPSLGRAGQMDYFKEYCEKRGLYKMGGADHSSVIGGYIPDDPIYDCPPDVIGIGEEDFMRIYERRLG